jgi:hypothetical protein
MSFVSPVQRGRFRAAVVASVLSLSVGCYRDPDVAKIVCGPPENQCPSGYVCKLTDGGTGAGRCCRPNDLLCGTGKADASLIETVTDVATAIASEGGITMDGETPIDVPGALDIGLDRPQLSPLDSAAGPDAPLSDATPSLSDADLDLPQSVADAPVDTAAMDGVPPGKDPGVGCSVGGECAGGNCVDGHCCASSTCPPCQGCTGAAGTCVADPYRSGQPCGAPQSCSAGVMVTADSCNNAGTCVPGTSTTCPYDCDGNRCAALAPIGTTCTMSAQCASGICAGVGTGTCQTSCGKAVGATCCIEQGGSCSALQMTCRGGICVPPCGAAGLECCQGSVCDTADLVCTGGLNDGGAAAACARCGQVGDLCCAGDTCTTGVCYNGRCLVN